MEATSEITGGRLRNYTEAPSGLSSRICHEHHRTHHPDPPRAPQARRRAAQLREGAGGRARGVRRGRRVDVARGDRAPRRGRDRHALPPLPQPPGAARGALRRRGRGGLPLGRASSTGADPWEALNGWFERFIGYIAHQAGARRRAAQLPRPRRAALQGLPRVALRAPASRCSSAPRRPASCARTSTSREVIQMVMGIAKIPTGDPGRPSTSSASRSTACATARTPRPNGSRRRRPARRRSRACARRRAGRAVRRAHPARRSRRSPD